MSKKASNADVAVIPFQGTGFGKIDPGDAYKRAQTAGTKMTPKVLSLSEPGMFLSGTLEGPGADIEMERPDGEVTSVKTWVFDLGGGARVAIMGSHQLDQTLPGLAGKWVRVTYLEQVNTRKGYRVKDYLIESAEDAELVAE